MSADTRELGQVPVGRLLFKMAVPAIMAQIINALYNIVDRIYIGHIPENGDLALTGLGVCFPIIMLVSAFAGLMAQGGAPIAAICMGKNENKKAEQLMGNCFVMLVIAAFFLTVFFQITKEAVLYKVGASAATLPYAMKYLNIYLYGTLPVLISLGMNSFINTQGFSNIGMKTVLIGAVLNIILDPIFIFGFNMGVEGAAIATILAQTISALWVCLFLIGKRTKLRLRFESMKLKAECVKSALSMGMSPFAMMSTESLIIIVLNSTLARTGGDVAVGSMTIISSMMQFVFLPLQGLSQGAQPIISYNFGAKLYHRVKHTFRLLFVCSVLFTAVEWVIVMLFAKNIAAIFTTSTDLIEFTIPMMRIYFCMVMAMGVQMSCQQTFLATGQAKISLFLALLRKVILLMPLALIFSNVWGTTGVYIAEPVADLTAATVTFLLFMKNRAFIFGKKVITKN